MTHEQFCYWLRGIVDTNTVLDARQMGTIRNKLNDLFEHVVEPVSPPRPLGGSRPDGAIAKC